MNKVDLYYDLLQQIKKTSISDYKTLILLCEKSWPLIPYLIEETKSEYGKFDINEIPALECPIMHLVCLDQKEKIDYLAEMINKYPELVEWRPLISDAIELISIKDKLLSFIKDNLGFKQKDLKKAFPDIDYQLISSMLYTLDMVGAVKRSKHGNTYLLYL